MFRRRLFLFRIWFEDVLERIFGIKCVRCGERARLPPPEGWRWETCFDGRARWTCGDCVVECEHRHWLQ